MRRVLAAMGAIGWLAAAAAAQPPPAAPEEPPQEETPTPETPAEPAPEGEPETPEEPEEPAVEELPPVRLPPFLLEVGWVGWDLDGNERKFRQYATPPRNLFVRQFRYAPLPRPSSYDTFNLRGLGEVDYRLAGRSAHFFGATQAEAVWSRHRFFDPTPALIPSSERAVQEVAAKQFLARGFAVSAHYRMDEQDQFFDVPRLSLHQRTRYRDLIAAGRLGPGQLSASIGDWRYWDRTGVLRDTEVDRRQLRYLWAPHRNAGLEAAYTRLSVAQPGVPGGRVQILSLEGNAAAGEATDLVVSLRRDTFSLPMVRTAYAREQRQAGLRLVQRWPGWSAQLGLRQREVERVRGDQTFVDVPRWWTLDGRLSGRLGRRARLTLRGYSEDLSRAPAMLTQDPRPLFWDGRRFAQLKLDGGSADLNGYLTWTYRRWENDARATRLSMRGLTVGGHWQLRRTVGLFAEYNREGWGARSEQTEFPRLAHFVPDSRVTALGLSWAASPQTFVSVNYTDFITDNDNPLLLRDGNTRGRFLTLQSRYLFPDGREVGLILAPWAYRDRVVGAMSYDTALVMLTAGARF